MTRIMKSTFILTLIFFSISLYSETPKKTEADHEAIYAKMMANKHEKEWRRYPFIGIPLRKKGPEIDGVVDTREWTESAELSYTLDMVSTYMVQDPINVYLCYDDSNFYLAFKIHRPENALKPGVKDFFELLMDIPHNHEKYHNLALGIEGIKWTGIGPSVDYNAWQPSLKYKVRCTDFGWEGELAIPFKEIKGFEDTPVPGTIWGFDIVRNERTPTDRLAHWAWRGTWHATKDLAHIMFTGKPLAIRLDSIGWMPHLKKLGAKIEAINFGDTAVSLDAFLELRRASGKTEQTFLREVDSAMTEDLGAAIGSPLATEIKNALEAYPVVQEKREKLTISPKSKKMINLTIADKPGDYLASFSINEGEELLVGMTVPFGVTVPLNIKLSNYLFSAGFIGYTVDLRRIKDKIVPGSNLEVWVTEGKQGKELCRAENGLKEGADSVTGELKFKFTPGTIYYVHAAVKNKGTEISSNETPFAVPRKPEWIGNNIGKSKFVPEPWVPLKANDKSCDSLTIKYKWDNSIFPEFTVIGLNILSGKISLLVEDEKGERVPVSLNEFKLAEKDIESVTYKFKASLKDIGTLSGIMKIEFDGFVWCDMTLTPNKKPAAISKLSLVVPVKKEYSTYTSSSRMPADYMKKFKDCNFTVGLMPEKGMRGPFIFNIWLGNREAGFQWYAENNKNWFNDDPGKAVEVVPEKDSNTLFINFVDGRDEVNKPLTWSFGFMPTPAKIDKRGYEDHAYFSTGSGLPMVMLPENYAEQNEKVKTELTARQKKEIDFLGKTLPKHKMKGYMVFSRWNEMFGYPGTFDPHRIKLMKKTVDLLNENNIKLMPYCGWGISTKCPEWENFGSELVALPLKNSGYDTYWAHPSTLYPDLYLYRLKELIEKHGVKGLYMDSTLTIRYSLNPQGMRWEDSKGKEQGSYAIRDMRDFAKRIYKVLHGEVCKDGVFYSHKSPPPNMAVENFVDIRCPSEFAQFDKGEMDERYVDYFIIKNSGVPFGVKVELTNKNWMRGKVRTLNQVLSVGLPLNISHKNLNFKNYKIPRNYALDTEPMCHIIEAFDWLGSANAEYLPWWKNQEYISTKPSASAKNQVLTAVWLKKGEKALVCVSNLHKKPRQIEVDLNLKKMGFEKVKIEDAITLKPVSHEGGKFKLDIDFERWRLLMIQPLEEEKK